MEANNSNPNEATQVLRAARKLLSRVRADIQARTFENDDARMRTFNYLLSHCRRLFPNDPVLSGMPTLPDSTLSAIPVGYLFEHPEVASKRLEEYLTSLIQRIE
jgi:hypothetical protein